MQNLRYISSATEEGGGLSLAWKLLAELLESREVHVLGEKGDDVGVEGLRSGGGRG